MIMGVYAVIQISPNVQNTARNYVFKPNDYENIYLAMMNITGGDHEIAQEAASWCEIATIGETYEFREGRIEICA